MPLLNESAIPSEVKPLFASAQAGKISPIEFCRELKELGIDEVPAMFYVSKAFNLPWEKAKKVVIEDADGSVEDWANSLADSISELEREED